MLTVGSATLATWEVPLLRQRIAPALTFSRWYHQQPHCIATLPAELGAKLELLEDANPLEAFSAYRRGQRIIRINECMADTTLHSLAVLHECCHQIVGLHMADCTGNVEARDERDAWISSAVVGVSRQLATLVVDGRADVAEIAERCRVPEPLVMVRLGLMYVLGEKRGPLGQALDTVRYWLRRLEDWIVAARRATRLRRSA